MFCPKCGQQSSEEVRFCPRCGFQIAGLAAYVAGNELTPARPDPPGATEMTPKRRGTRRGAKVIFWSVVIFPVFFALAIAFDSPLPLVAPLTLFLAGLATLAYAQLFGEDLRLVHRRGAHAKDLGAGADRPALGAPQLNTAPFFTQQRADTAEIYQPPSVTENTTRLLDKDS